VLLAVAAQLGREWFGRPRVWPVAMTLVIADLLQRVHYGLAHYTQVPETRTADFYPMLVALSVPALLVIAARAIGPWAPLAAAVVTAALPVTVGVGALSGWVGWVLGGFVRAVAHGDSPAVGFGDQRRARVAALLAGALILAGSLATYRPQRFGPPMTTTEMQL